MTTAVKERNFADYPINPDYCFLNHKSTEQWTHGYHRYPAKFLPNLVKKIIEEYTTEDDVIADFFAGCGTTLVEAKAHGRQSLGVDINPVSRLITEVKIKPIGPTTLQRHYEKLTAALENREVMRTRNRKQHERLDYWFWPEQKDKIEFIFLKIKKITYKPVRDFFLVALSNILKTCSKWLQSSTKPQIDPNKPIVDPFDAFHRQVRSMIKKNRDFLTHLRENKFTFTGCEIALEDARKTSITSGSIGAIITSPPYVTSYEYADIHQLTALWFEYVSNLAAFRKSFIGTFYSGSIETETSSQLGKKVIADLLLSHPRTAREVANYLRDMELVIKEMHRVLRFEGHACIVIGNTTLRGVVIKSAEIIAEILEIQGFKLVETIKRSIPNKLIPTIREIGSGRFAKIASADSKLVYPDEYILIAKKK